MSKIPLTLHRTLDVSAFDGLLKDHYPLPGTRLKQYVVDARREHAWEFATCPRVEVFPHDDNTGAGCRNVGTPKPWIYLDHDCCYVCGDLHTALSEDAGLRPDITEWLSARRARPPICVDRDVLSDEFEPERAYVRPRMLP